VVIGLRVLSAARRRNPVAPEAGDAAIMFGGRV
jgi:hypothetical protein